MRPAPGGDEHCLHDHQVGQHGAAQHQLCLQGWAHGRTLPGSSASCPVASGPPGMPSSCVYAPVCSRSAPAGVLWGTGGLAVQVIRDHADLSPTTISAYRTSIAAVVLVVACVATRQLGDVRRLLAERPGPTVFVGLATAAYQALYFASVVWVGVTVSTVVSLGVAPLALADPRLRAAPTPARPGRDADGVRRAGRPGPGQRYGRAGRDRRRPVLGCARGPGVRVGVRRGDDGRRASRPVDRSLSCSPPPPPCGRVWVGAGGPAHRRAVDDVRPGGAGHAALPRRPDLRAGLCACSTPACAPRAAAPRSWPRCASR